MGRKFSLKQAKSHPSKNLRGAEARFFVFFLCFWTNTIAQSVVNDKLCVMAKFSPDSPCFNKGCQGNLQGDSRKVNVNWLNKLGFLEEQMSDLLGKPLCENCNLFGFNMWKQGFTAIAGGCSLKRRRQVMAFESSC